jgi:hypothetical protein
MEHAEDLIKKQRITILTGVEIHFSVFWVTIPCYSLVRGYHGTLKIMGNTLHRIVGNQVPECMVSTKTDTIRQEDNFARSLCYVAHVFVGKTFT